MACFLLVDCQYILSVRMHALAGTDSGGDNVGDMSSPLNFNDNIMLLASQCVCLNLSQPWDCRATIPNGCSKPAI